MLRCALGARHKIRCYTYVDKDAVSRRIVAAVLQKVQNRFPDQLSDAAIRGFEDRLPQNVDRCSSTFFTNLVERHGPVDMLGAN